MCAAARVPRSSTGRPRLTRACYLGSGKRRYNIKMWKKFQEVFNVLPFAAVVDEKIFCIHAGLSPDLNNPNQIKHIMRPTDVPDAGDRGAPRAKHPHARP